MAGGGKKKPIEIQGMTFASMTEAAQHFGVSVTAIHHAKRRGRLHTVGDGSRFHTYRPCEVAGKEYPSLQHAAADLGVLPQEVSAYLKVNERLQHAT